MKIMDKNFSDFAFYIHTHTDCLDAMAICLGQLKKYFPNIKRYIVSNCNHPLYNQDSLLLYDEKQIYSKRLATTLPQVVENKIIYMHEDMIPYAEADLDELIRVCACMDNNDIDFIRLCPNVGIGQEVLKNIRQYHGNYYFSVQPTIWKKNSFINFMSSLSMSIWDLERYAQNDCRSKYNGYTYFNGTEKLRGEQHFDSSIFPYVATAIVKGKWNNLEYERELRSLIKEYSISSDRSFMI